MIFSAFTPKRIFTKATAKHIVGDEVVTTTNHIAEFRPHPQFPGIYIYEPSKDTTILEEKEANRVEKFLLKHKRCKEYSSSFTAQQRIDAFFAKDIVSEILANQRELRFTEYLGLQAREKLGRLDEDFARRLNDLKAEFGEVNMTGEPVEEKKVFPKRKSTMTTGMKTTGTDSE